MRGAFRAGILWCTLASILLGCGSPSASLEEFFPEPAALSGWAASGEIQIYDSDRLYDLVNGQAEAFFAYAFEQVAVRSYENDGGATLRVEIWQLATPSDAYGLFSTYRSGDPVEVGNEGAGDPRRRIAFWQDHYFVRLIASQEVPRGNLGTVAEAVSSLLPAGGHLPALLARLPQDGLVGQSSIFFHQELSIQDYLWLGGQNILGLGPETDGVLARYEGEDGPAYLLLIQYPSPQSATTGFNALQTASANDWVAVKMDEELLGAVFGAMSEPLARSLLQAVFAEY